MFGSIRSEFQCLERLGQNSTIWKEKVRIGKFATIRPEFQYLKG